MDSSEEKAEEKVAPAGLYVFDFLGLEVEEALAGRYRCASFEGIVAGCDSIARVCTDDSVSYFESSPNMWFARAQSYTPKNLHPTN